jgi:RNA polymerase sigma-70 factor (ECF subfamily)
VKDQQLVKDFLKNRSEVAFSQLYREQTPALYKIALRLTRNAYTAEELIQEMWVVAASKLQYFRWEAKLKTWLTAILINLYKAEHRKSVRHESVELNDDLVATPVKENTIEVDDLEKAIANLPAGYREVIILHDVEGYKHKEIAKMLGVTEGTSKSQLFYARRMLRGFLNEYANKN